MRTLGAEALKGLAHPLRMEIYDVLMKHGPQTSTSLAKRLGESSGSTSYHLRQLARHRFIRQVESTSGGREKWWERTPGPVDVSRRSAQEDPAASASAGFVLREWARSGTRALEDFVDALTDTETMPDRWADASAVHTSNVRVTPEQLREINDHFYRTTQAFIDEYRGRNDPGSRPVQIQFNAFPLIDGEETPS
ncbi:MULTISPECIES: winged helix-turn-helix domain-containing protein [unclassified Brevibacterium]|uniref:winged helix-turn-helix domain-containing protein n=1 Tax=unclassified Brevibacterium TaxID=2614124 RepID=UPI001092FCB3|nr:helix-turn-helix domain-containing protein [Brevibacterium sp. S22]TGD32026.1 ArsR family transcriptional regulator [Brevibacterium sp. S22]